MEVSLWFCLMLVVFGCFPIILVVFLWFSHVSGRSGGRANGRANPPPEHKSAYPRGANNSYFKTSAWNPSIFGVDGSSSLPFSLPCGCRALGRRRGPGHGGRGSGRIASRCLGFFVAPRFTMCMVSGPTRYLASLGSGRPGGTGKPLPEIADFSPHRLTF